MIVDQTVNIDAFDRVSLRVLQEQLLMKRKESKFFFADAQLSALLTVLNPRFDVLEVDDIVEQRYYSHYLDTPQLMHYMDHHNRRANRYKLRFRDYTDSKLSFFELKFKTNKRVTMKSRISVPFMSREISSDVVAFLEDAYRHPIDQLYNPISTRYKRLSLISKDRQARITIDKEIEFIKSEKVNNNPGLVIMELKYSDGFDHNHYVKAFKNNSIYKSSISKYCTGITSHYPKVKKNLFLPTLRRISTLTKQATL